MSSAQDFISFTAILPIKFNSERVPGKNFRAFRERPLYEHILQKLAGVERITKIVINTDAPLSSFNQMFGDSKFEFSARPKHLIGETISMNAIIDYEIQRTNDEFFFMTHTTNPLISSLTINAMLDAFILNRGIHDSVVSVTKFYGRFFDKSGEPLNHNPAELVRTQDLDPVLFENSCGYVFSDSSFKKSLSRIGDKPLYFATPKLESIDIDDEDDWMIASALSMLGDKNV